MEDAVTSPTFTIIKEYRGRLPLYHFDVYRLSGPAELAPLGHEEYFYGEGVTVIEWGDKINEALPDDRLTIEMHRTVESPDRRQLKITAGGPRSKKLLQGLAAK